MTRPATTTSLTLLLILFLSGCVTTQKRYDKAAALEAEGRYAEAANAYILTMQRDPEFADVRERLLDVGSKAAAAYLDEAEAAEDEHRFEDALGRLDRIDALRDAAYEVGVTLPMADTYGDYRQRLVGAAIAEVVDRGDAAEAAGEWAEALEHYGRAQERYPLTPSLHGHMDEARARVFTKWADEDLQRDMPRTAWDHAQEAIAILGPEARGAEAALGIQQTAVEQGTRQVAFLPFWRLERWMREAPPTTLQDLNDVLTYEFWSEPPLFITVADPVQLRRELRRLRYDRTSLDRTKASEVGRLFDADYVVAGEAIKFERTEKIRKEETKKARTKGRNAKDTTYVWQRLDLTFTAEVNYQIIDPSSRRVVEENSIEAKVTEQVERGVYSDYTDLDLPSRERRYFDPEEHAEREREMENQLVDDLSARLADRIYSELLVRIR